MLTLCSVPCVADVDLYGRGLGPPKGPPTWVYQRFSLVRRDERGGLDRRGVRKAQDDGVGGVDRLGARGRVVVVIVLVVALGVVVAIDVVASASPSAASAPLRQS